MRGVATGSAEFRTDSQVSVYLDDQPMTANLAAGRGPSDRPRAGRGAARPAGDALRVELADRHPRLHHEQARHDRLFRAVRCRGQHDQGRRGKLRRQRARQHSRVRQLRRARRRLLLDEGGYVDNVFGRTLDGQFDNAAAVEEDWNDWTTYGGRVAARWQISPMGTTASLIGQLSRKRGRVGFGPGARRLQDHALLGRVPDDNWYQASLNLKGDLGFAELSATASVFRPRHQVPVRQLEL